MRVPKVPCFSLKISLYSNVSACNWEKPLSCSSLSAASVSGVSWSIYSHRVS